VQRQPSPYFYDCTRLTLMPNSTAAYPAVFPLVLHEMAGVSSDVYILAAGVLAASLYLFRGSIFPSSEPSKPTTSAPVRPLEGQGDPRNFVEKMKKGVRIPVVAGPGTPNTSCSDQMLYLEQAHCHLLRLADRHC